jgi:hypothetical protein
VIAILVTIMVMDMHTPQGTTWHALRESCRRYPASLKDLLRRIRNSGMGAQPV